jgi:hypothetical protein
MATSVQEAVARDIAAVAAALFVLSAALRFTRVDKIWTGLFVPAAFLGAYWLTYNKIPSFPPVGAVNKVFYVAAVGTLVGLGLDALRKPFLSRVAILAQPIAIAFYIGQARLEDGLLDVTVAALAGTFAQLLLSWDAHPENPDRHVDLAVLLGIACLGFGPIALLGASSSGFQLCLIVAAGVGAALVWHLRRPAFRFGPTAFLGGWGGLLALMDTVILITRKSNYAAIAILYLIILVPLLSEHISNALKIKSGIARRAIFTIACLVPAAAAIAVAVLTYPSDFPT